MFTSVDLLLKFWEIIENIPFSLDKGCSKSSISICLIAISIIKNLVVYLCLSNKSTVKYALRNDYILLSICYLTDASVDMEYVSSFIFDLISNIRIFIYFRIRIVNFIISVSLNIVITV
jgi:hypothetical protein